MFASSTNDFQNHFISKAEKKSDSTPLCRVCYHHLIVGIRINLCTSAIFIWQKGESSQTEPKISYAEGARDFVVIDAMLESGNRQGALVQVKKT